MNKKLLIYFIGLIFLLQYCNSPSTPEGITIKSILTYNTGGYCRDIALYDSTLAAAADQNGYFIYRININGNGSITNLDTIFHDNDTNPYAGDDLATEVDFSSDGDALFILDPLDLINMKGVDPDAFVDPLEVPKCSGWNLYRSMALNQSDDHDVILYSLLKHIEADTNASYLPYSTSIVTQKCVDYGVGNDVILDCSCTSTINNLSYYLMEISFSDPLLTITNDQMGVLVFKENETDELEYFSSFDTPGTSESVYSNGNTVFSGLSNDQGCYIALLDDEGQVSSNLQIAEGYSIKDININHGLLALACGNDGVLLYEWNGDLNISPLGKISTAYVYTIEVYDRNTIIAGTRDGIQIINFKD